MGTYTIALGPPTGVILPATPSIICNLKKHPADNNSLSHLLELTKGSVLVFIFFVAVLEFNSLICPFYINLSCFSEFYSILLLFTLNYNVSILCLQTTQGYEFASL